MKKQPCIGSEGEFSSYHASSICELPDNDLFAVCYAGKEEGSKDSVILGARYDRDINEWSKSCLILNVPGRAPANPRVFLGPKNRELWLLCGVNYGERWCSGGTYLFLKRSRDFGRSWMDLELFWEEPGLLGRNHPLQVNNTWIIPCEDEELWSPRYLLSRDSGASWRLIKGDKEMDHPEEYHLIQPTLVKFDNEEIISYMRSQEGYIFKSITYDRGESWTKPEPTSLPNNNSGIDIAKLASGNIVLAFNPTGLSSSPKKLESTWPSDLPQGFNMWGNRTPLILALSEDKGKTWTKRITLEEGSGEYSYPSVIQDSQKSIHVVYTHRRDYIMHAELGGGFFDNSTFQ